MKARACGWLAILALLAGCKPAAPPAQGVDVSVLHFPVVVLHPNSAPVLHESAEDLHTMHSNHLLAEGAHTLIDSSFQFYTLEHLSSAKSGLGQMLGGGGNTPVTFELKREPISGAAAARETFNQRCAATMDEAALAARRRALEKAATLVEMLEAFRDSSP